MKTKTVCRGQHFLSDHLLTGKNAACCSMKKLGIALLLTLVLPVASVSADGCSATTCANSTTSQNQVCDEALQGAKGIQLPGAVWQSLHRGQPQRLLVAIVDADLSSLTRPQQLDAYQSRKKIIVQSLPVDGATVLRQFDQLPMVEIEIRTAQALRGLLVQCFVANVYPDQEEPPLRPRGQP